MTRCTILEDHFGNRITRGEGVKVFIIIQPRMRDIWQAQMTGLNYEVVRKTCAGYVELKHLRTHIH